MAEYSDGDVVDLVTDDLDPHTIRAVQHAVEGFPPPNQEQSLIEMSARREGKHRGIRLLSHFYEREWTNSRKQKKTTELDIEEVILDTVALEHESP